VANCEFRYASHSQVPSRFCIGRRGLLLGDGETHGRGSPGRCRIQGLRYDAWSPVADLEAQVSVVGFIT
jgi:hypothetical protein